MTRHLTIEQAIDLAVGALTASGASPRAASSVAKAVVSAHTMGRTNVGFEHLPYYCAALRRGAIRGRTEPTVRRASAGVLEVDAHSGFTHYAFDHALDEFTSMVEDQGVALLTIRNTYTCGALGYFPERLAREGFAAVAATNAGPAAVAPSGAQQAVFSTNPIAFAFPRPGGPPLLVDQSTSACTLVDVHAARDRGEPIPGDWALDSHGKPTRDAATALQGSFKPFGGYKGSNLALLVELLAAGLSGGNWSIDAASFADGVECPDVGQWFLAMDLKVMNGGAAGHRIDRYLARLASLGCHIPGKARQERAAKAGRDGVAIEDDLYQAIRTCCGSDRYNQTHSETVMTQTNDLGQPIGDPVPDWQAPPRPSRDPMGGRYCRIEHLDPGRHAQDLFEANALDTEHRNWTYLPYGPFASVEDYRSWMRADCSGDDPLFHAVIDAASGRATGVASYLRITPASGFIEVGHINFSPRLQRTAAATEAMYLMMARAFELGYRRYEWKCDALNEPSCTAARRLGFSYEGTFRQATIYKRRNRDTAWFSILDSEWPRMKAAFESWLAPGNFDDAGRQKRRLEDFRGVPHA